MKMDQRDHLEVTVVPCDLAGPFSLPSSSWLLCQQCIFFRDLSQLCDYIIMLPPTLVVFLPHLEIPAGKDRPKVEISVSAETESHAESGIRLSAETEITPKENTRFRPKSETESACDLSLYPRGPE